MIDILKDILPYISGLYTLPWILVGFVITILISRFIGKKKIEGAPDIVIRHCIL